MEDTQTADTPRHAAPLDHLQPTQTTRTVTIDNLTITVNPRKLTDFRVVNEMYDITYNGDGLKIVGLLRRLLGQDQYERVLDALADPDGVVDPERVNTFLTRLFQQLAPNS